MATAQTSQARHVLIKKGNERAGDHSRSRPLANRSVLLTYTTKGSRELDHFLGEIVRAKNLSKLLLFTHIFFSSWFYQRDKIASHANTALESQLLGEGVRLSIRNPRLSLATKQDGGQ